MEKNKTMGEVFESFDYHELNEYQELSVEEKHFFDKIYNLLLFDGSINWSNSKLSHMFQMPESTLEKRLAKVDKAGLIIRETSSDMVNGCWKQVSRIIRLNPVLFQFNFKSLTAKAYSFYIWSIQASVIMRWILNLPKKDFDKMIDEMGKEKDANNL